MSEFSDYTSSYIIILLLIVFYFYLLYLKMNIITEMMGFAFIKCGFEFNVKDGNSLFIRLFT